MRSKTYLRNASLEQVLKTINSSILPPDPVEHDQIESGPVYIVGAPRSGTTLCLQWLAAMGSFAYPTNFVARFWSAPYLGETIHQMLTDPNLNFRDELASPVWEPGNMWNSDLGKTKGFFSPSEFWYFWRHHFPSDGDIGISLARATREQKDQFNAQLAMWQTVSGKPAVMKALIADFEIAELAAMQPTAIFIYIDRDPVEATFSLLGAREKFYGNRETWYSFRTPNFDALQPLDPVEQVAAQIQTTRKSVRAALDQLPENRYLHIRYAELCSNTDLMYAQLRDLMARNGIEMPEAGPEVDFQSRSRAHPPAELDAVQAAVEKWA